jgi:arylsulfatase A-like enzyme
MNILFIFADQMHRYALGCMGTPEIQTPNLDRLAAQGTLFRSAYSNCPICTAFRINLLTGLHSGTTRTIGNNFPIPEGCRTLPDALNDGGYRTSYVGKWHIGATGNVAVPHELRGGFTDFIGYQCYNGFRENVWFFDEQDEKHVYEGHRTDVTTQIAVERLRGLATQDRFALFVSYQAPHYPVQPSAAFEQMYAGVEITHRPNFRDVEPYTRTWSPPSPWPPGDCPDYQRYGGDMDEYMRRYYGMVSQVDAGVGRLLQCLEQLGLADTTAVVFTADHGDMQGSHGYTNKCGPLEESAGIPLIVRVPGGAQGQVTDAVISGVDFFPTCLDYGSLPAGPRLPGRSFAPLTRGEKQELTGPIFSEFGDWKMVRRGACKLVVDADDLAPTELYDLGADPYEMQNLVANPAYAEQQAALQAELVSWRAGSGS